MLTWKDIQKEKRRALYAERKQIESALHPTPTLNGYNISHRHAGQQIYFSVWKGSNQIGGINTELSIPRQDVLDYGKDFYSAFKKEMETLVWAAENNETASPVLA